MPGARVLRLEDISPQEALTAFVRAAQQGQLLLFPTDTVYGLGGRADSEATVAAIFAAKQRPPDLALPVLVGDRESLRRTVSVWPESAERLASRFWPGPLTLVLPRAAQLAPGLSPGRATVGVRMPGHAVLRSWLAACEVPMAVTSANLSGCPPAVAAQDIAPELLAAVDVLLDGGRCREGVASTVVDLTGSDPIILRAGRISEAEIHAALV